VSIDVRIARDFGGANVVKNLIENGLKTDDPERTFFTFDRGGLLDHLLTHDNTAAIIGKIDKELDEFSVCNPLMPIIVLDHVIPADSEKTATNHKKIRSFVEKFGIKNFYDVGCGICHQVVIEKGLALPYSIIVGSDSHTCSYGALGAFSTGIDRTEAAALLLTGETRS